MLGSRSPRVIFSAVLSLLAVLFLGRVLAQLIQAWHPLPILPPFDLWHSATLPYPLLLVSQVAILAAQAIVIWRLASGTHVSRRQTGLCLLVVGTLYLGSMLFRLVAGLTILADRPWFQAHVPTIFHLVLASFLLVLAAFHLSGASPPTNES